MGVDLGNSMGSLIGAGAGMIGGGIGGFRGTPDQYQYQDTESQLKVGDKSAQQKSLEKQSYQQYLKAVEAANLAQATANEADPYRKAAMEQQLAILTGQGFGANEQELQQINNIRNAMVQQGSQGINQFMDTNMRNTVASAAGQGLRGQALGELQGRVIESGNQQMGALQNQANLQAAQLAVQLPQQRMQMQSQAAAQGLSYAQQLQQQALQNRLQTQNPYLLAQLQNERMATGKQIGNTTNMTPGAKGGFWSGIQGAMTGMAAGANAGAQVQQAVQPTMQGGGQMGGGGGGQGYYQQPATVQGQPVGAAMPSGVGNYGNYGGMV